MPLPRGSRRFDRTPPGERPARFPTHVGVVMDGNRRWARAAGHLSPSLGHRRGAEHLEDLLGWCVDAKIGHVTAYVLSADNIRKRDAAEVGYLVGLLDESLTDLLARNDRWALHVSGDTGLLPEATAARLVEAQATTAARACHLTLAIGYDGHVDILEGIRRALRTVGADIDDVAITAALPGGPVKEIDLVIRTSGEHRLSGFFPWQTSRAEIYLSPKLWPDFTAADFADALRFYASARAE